MTQNPYSVTTEKGNVQAGEEDNLWIPRTRLSNHGVVLCHGAATLDMFLRQQWPASAALAAILAGAGIPCVAGDFGSTSTTDPWANDTHLARIDSAMAYMATKTGVPANKAHFFGISMGNGAITRYSENNPTKVCSLQGAIPMSNMQRLYNTDTPAGARLGICTAWGLAAGATRSIGIHSGTPNIDGTFTAPDVGKVVTGTGIPLTTGQNGVATTILSQTGTAAVMSQNASVTNAALTATFYPGFPMTGLPNGDLIGNAGALSAIPSRWFYSTVDPYITPSDVTALAAAAGGLAVAIDSGYGHADGSIGLIAGYNGGSLYSDFINFIMAHDA